MKQLPPPPGDPNVGLVYLRRILPQEEPSYIPNSFPHLQAAGQLVAHEPSRTVSHPKNKEGNGLGVALGALLNMAQRPEH